MRDESINEGATAGTYSNGVRKMHVFKNLTDEEIIEQLIKFLEGRSSVNTQLEDPHGRQTDRENS